VLPTTVLNNTITSIAQHPALWRADALAKTETPSIATGFAALDVLLPGGGWPTGAISEILLAHRGIGELGLAAPALARMSADRHVAFIAPPHIPYAPALAARGIKLSNLLIVRADSDHDALWAAEQCLRSGACGAVLAWPRSGDDRALRRLQLAAEAGKTWGLLYRPARFAAQPSPAPLRLALAPASNSHDARGGVMVRILKRRGGGAVAPLCLAIGKL
jgi:hypothetical protein